MGQKARGDAKGEDRAKGEERHLSSSYFLVGALGLVALASVFVVVERALFLDF